MAERIPGIIVRVVNSTGTVAPPAFQRYPCIVGLGDPYRLVENTAIVRSAGSVDDIPSISTVNEIVSVGDLPGIASYTEGTDYYLIGDSSNRISWSPAGSQPTEGNQYYITYTETRAASAYQATLYFNENLVYTDHGNKTRTDGSLNDISVGANLAFQNGASGVYVVQLDDREFSDPDNPSNSELETAFENAVDVLEEIFDSKLWLVPMSSGTLNTTTAANILFNHAVLASQPEQKQERSVLHPMPKNTAYTAYATRAQAYANERMIVPAIPSTLQVTGFTGTKDSRYYCAGLAGKLCAGPIGATIYDEVIAGLTFTDNFSRSQQNYMVQNGVSPAKSASGIARNIMAISTDTTSALTEDLGVQDVKDYVKKYWREKLWQVYRNKPITNTLPNAVKQSSEGILAYLQQEETIADYRNVTVLQDGTEPRQLNVTGEIQPAFGLAYMDVTFTFVLTFG